MSTRRLIGWEYRGFRYAPDAPERPGGATPIYENESPLEFREPDFRWVRDANGDPNTLPVRAPLPHGWREDPR